MKAIVIIPFLMLVGALGASAINEISYMKSGFLIFKPQWSLAMIEMSILILCLSLLIRLITRRIKC